MEAVSKKIADSFIKVLGTKQVKAGPVLGRKVKKKLKFNSLISKTTSPTDPHQWLASTSVQYGPAVPTPNSSMVGSIKFSQCALLFFHAIIASSSVAPPFSRFSA